MNSNTIEFVASHAFGLLGHVAMLALVLTAWFRRREAGFMLAGIGSGIGLLCVIGNGILMGLILFHQQTPATLSHVFLIMRMISGFAYVVTLAGWAFIAFKKPPTVR